MNYPKNYLKSSGTLTGTDENDKVIRVGHLDFATGVITIWPQVKEITPYMTSDGQSYWSMISMLPTHHDEDLLRSTVGKGSVEESTTLVGYIRRSKPGVGLKLSLNVEAMEEISNFPDPTILAFNQPALYRVIKGERAVTTIISAEGYQPPVTYRDAINRKTVFDRKA